jgi:predicted transcriptional regulator
MKYRNRTELIALTLKAISGGSNLSAADIMYSAFLSYAQMKKYLSISMDAGLIAYQERNPRSFRITGKGMRFLHLYKMILVNYWLLILHPQLQSLLRILIVAPPQPTFLSQHVYDMIMHASYDYKSVLAFVCEELYRNCI